MSDTVLPTAPSRAIPGRPALRSALHIVHSPDAPRAGETFDLTSPGASWTFGRSAPATVNDARLSRAHVTVSRAGPAARVEDLNSSNGTYLLGQRIERDYLTANAVVRAGDTLFVLDEEAPGAAPPAEAPAGAIPELVGRSFAADATRRWLHVAAPTGGTVLLLGPSGSGKEVAARAIHRLSERPGQFVAVNCAAIAPDLADAELFGHRKGAFTGAADGRPGLFGEAHRGTLFLDEVGDLPPGLQVKLLRAIEEGCIRPVGETTTRSVDVRVVAATNVDVEKSGFRADLRARLSQWVVRLPPLAQRRVDILPLAQHFVRMHAPALASRPWTAELVEALLLCSWPLNVRELESLIRRMATIGADRAEWDLDLLPLELQRPLLDRSNVPAEEASTEPGRDELDAALRAAGGNVAQVAQKYSRDRAQVYRWMRRHQLDPGAYR